MSQATSNSSATVVIDSNTSGQWGTYNLGVGPFWSGNDIWNAKIDGGPGGELNNVSYTSGSNIITGFSDTSFITPGMQVFSPDIPGNSATVLSVSANSIVVSVAANASGNNYITFPLQSNTGQYEQTITNNPATFPNGTVMTWNFPNTPNAGHVYSYPFIVYGNLFEGPNPSPNDPPGLQLNAIQNLTMNYNVTMNAPTNGYDGLIETWVNTNPISALGTATTEVGLFFHSNADVINYMLGSSHINYSQNGFNAIIVTTWGLSSVTGIAIMPVTTPGGSTPLQMDSGNQTIPWGDLFRFLVAQGFLNGNNYVDGMELGFEIEAGSGSATINNLSYNWNNSALTTVPAAPVIASFSPDSNIVGDGITNVKILTLSGTADANSTLTVFDGTLQLGTATANASGAWSFTTGSLADGAHRFTATDTNAAGTSAASSVLNVTVDTLAPTPVISNFIENSNGTVTLSGTSEANSALSIYDGNNTTPLGMVTTAANGTWSFTSGVLTGANHSFRARAVDVAGNVGSTHGGIHYGGRTNDPLTVSSGTLRGIAKRTHQSQHFTGDGHDGNLLLKNGQQLTLGETNDTSIIDGGGIGTLGSSWAITGNNVFTEWQSAGSGFIPNVGAASTNSILAVTADFNSHSKADQIWRNTSTGVFTVQQSTGNGLIPNMSVTPALNNLIMNSSPINLLF